MKKALTLTGILLALALCLTAAFASGGSASDPLVSLSHLLGLFTQSSDALVEGKLDDSDDAVRSAVEQELDEMRAAAQAAAGQDAAPVATEISLKQGDLLAGVTGMIVCPLAGDVVATTASGTLVDATAGCEVPSGTTLSPNHRYLVAEDSLVRFVVTSPSAVLTYQGTYAFAFSHDHPDYYAIACALRELGLFRGTDTVFGEGFDLHKAPTRAQGLVMFIRVLGEEADALACTYDHPFTDVPAWMDRYAAWAYHKGYTNGIGDNRFGSDLTLSAVEYEEFLLRALGYSVAGVHDYTTSLERALELGALTPEEYRMLSEDPFLRAQVAYVSYYALDVIISGSQQTLAQKLESAGLFTPYQKTIADSYLYLPRIG